jgi:low affinity Fe/Cu permease|tara:strand:- start:1184 stop:2143 length:960 start_codon:yes stop_codon:yes gene_type:complete
MVLLIGLLFSALSVSAVAAYFSIVGLMAIFSGLPQSIFAMGVALEIAKLVTASWVYQYWAKTQWVMKTYMVLAIIILSIITSIGIFGFLSKAHIDQTATNADYALNIDVIEFRLDAEVSKLNQARNRIVGLDDTLRTSQGKDKNYVNGRQRVERAELNAQMDAAVVRIDELNLELLPMRQQTAQMDAEIGPIKYISELIYEESGKDSVDKSVRIIILLLMFVFDPLAIVLVIAANMSFKERTGGRITMMSIDESVVEEQIIPESPAEASDDAGHHFTSEPHIAADIDDWVMDKYGTTSGSENLTDGEKKKLKWLIDKET